MFDRSRLKSMKDLAIRKAEAKGYVKVEGDTAQLTNRGLAFGYKFSQQFPEIEFVIFLQVCGWIASELRNPEQTLEENAARILEAINMKGVESDGKDEVQDNWPESNQ